MPDAKLVSIGGEQVDLSRALPFTMGDWRALGKKGVNVLALPKRAREEALTVEDFLAIAGHAVRKVRPATTDEELDGLSLKAVSDVAAACMAAEQEGPAVDTPTSTGSSSSPST